ncbi:MAG: TonB-dependent receptor [Barnesiella sp.]|nr:TonB-dependent receptor [Barnesiella sp.]
MKRKYISALMAAALLTTGVSVAQATEGGGSYEAVAPAAQQVSACTGTVLDELGDPLVGATVKVVGNAAKATSTDVDGRFKLDGVKPGQKVIVSFIGYNDATAEWNGQPITIKMSENTTKLDEVVVLGYTVQSKESLTGALTSIKDEKLKDVTTPNLANMLNGKVSGVYVAPGSGQPGAGAAVVIRGQASLSGSTAPIWVVDGVIVGTGAGDLNPDDVESMTILKDAASTAIYGSDGANGVVVVTTKKGKAGTMKASAAIKLGISNLTNGKLEMMNGAELYDYYASFQNAESIRFTRWTPELRNDNFDWWDLATHTGFSQDYHVSISGGNDKLSSYFSLGYYDEDGAVKGYKFQKYSFRATTDYKPFSFLTIRPTLYGSRRDIKDRQYSVSSMYSMLPWDSPFDEDGNLVPNRYSGWVNSQNNNYLNDLEAGNEGTSVNYEFNGNFDFDVQFTPWLKWQSVNSYRFNQYKTHSYTDPRSVGGQNTDGQIYEWSSDVVRKSTNQKLFFNKTFGSKHRLDGMLAYEYKDYKYTYMSATGTGFVPGFQVLDVTAVPAAVGGGVSEWAVESYFTKWNYMYDSKYLLEAGFRRDGASNLGKKWGNLYSVSGGWIINRESWFTAPWVSFLKLRASYGSVGNRPSSLYPQYDLYSVGVNYDGVPGALISQIGNKDLTWERTFTGGVGVDANFFNDRLRVNVDWYNKSTDNVIYAVPVTGLVGVTSIYRNIGKMRNRGFEVTVGGEIIATRDWTWSLEANFTTNKNELRDLYAQKNADGTYEVKPVLIGDGSGIAGSASRILEVGEPVDTYWLKEWAGVNPENGAPQWYMDDENGNKVITDSYAKASYYKIGNVAPDFYGGFNTSLRWKQLDLNANFGFSVGGKIFNYSRIEYDSDGTYTDRNQMKLQSGWSRWEKPGDIATHPVAKYNNTDQGNLASSRFLEDADFLKLRSLTIGYNFNQLKQYGISNLRVSFSGENLFTVTKYSGVDPELPASGGTVMGTTGPSVYPSVRRFSLGINITL